jgi:tetratricopeptide (TPR) repeat protein
MCLVADLRADELQTLLDEGQALASEGKIQDALAIYQKATAHAPDSATAHFRLAGMQLVNQEYTGAVQSFQRAISLDAHNADAFIGLAVAYIHQGKYPLASAALDEAARIDPSKASRVQEIQTWLRERAGQPRTTH